MKKIKLTYSNIIYILFLITPFMDMINGFIIRNYNVRGIGLIWHFILLIIFTFMWGSYKNIKYGFLEHNFLLFIICSVISLFVNTLIGVAFTSIALERELKIISTMLLCISFWNLYKNGAIDHRTIKKIVEKQCVIVLSFVFISDILGVYNYAYVSSNKGRIGLYTNTNELSIILCSLVIYQITKLIENFEFKRILLVVIGSFCLIFTESKVSLFMVAFSFFYYIINIIFKFRGSISKKAFIAISSLIPSSFILIYFIKDKITEVLVSMLERQSFLFKVYGGNNFIHYISSGRTTRFDSLIVEPLSSLVCSNNVFSVLTFLFTLFFGNGLSNGYNETMEMDPFDILILNGIIGLLIYINIVFFIIKKSIKSQGSIKKIIPLLVIVVSSIVMGHVWTGGVCNLYFALFSILYMSSNRRVE